MIVGLFTNLLANGGIPRVSRHVCSVLKEIADKEDGDLHLLSLNDPVGVHLVQAGSVSLKARGFGRNKVEFALAFLKTSKAANRIYIAHPNLAPLAFLRKLLRHRVYCIVATHGIEVWEAMPLIRRLSLRRIDVVTAPSKFTAIKLIEKQKIPTAKVAIVPWAIDPQFVPHNSHRKGKSLKLPAGKILLTVGRMDASERMKGVDDVIRALPGVLKKVPNAFYIVVGEGDDIPRLQALAKEVGVERNLFFTGSLTDGELVEYYDACDIFVMPSRSEGFGLVFLEAMASGKPVIAGSYGGASDIVIENSTGFLVNHGDMEKLEERITRLLLDKDLCQRMGEAGRLRVKENFTFDVFHQRLREVLLTNGSRGSAA